MCPLMGKEPVRNLKFSFVMTIMAIAMIGGNAAHASMISSQYYTFYDGDFNGDGLADLIMVPKPRYISVPAAKSTLLKVSERPMVIQKNADGTFLSIYPANLSNIDIASLTPTSYNLLAGDFNGDGEKDMLFQAPSNSIDTFIAYSDGIGASLKAVSNLGHYGISQTAATIEIKDLQGDGIDDIAITLNDGSAKYAYGGSAFIDQSNMQVVSRVPGSEVLPNIDGAFQVDESGAATYSLGVDVPPAPSGMMPEIGLSYSSNGGSGNLGVGWSMSVGSSISRCPTTLDEDGYIDGVDFDSNDQYCLDGVRLILVSGSHGTNGAEYRLANNNVQRVFIRSASSGPLVWEVQSPKGASSFYGDSVDSRFSNSQGQVLLWHLSSTKNVYGDSIEYTYNSDKSGGEDYIDHVIYGKNLGYKVQFDYQDRPDAAEGYISGVHTASLQRLSGIHIFIPGRQDALDSYQFAYQDGDDKNSKLLYITHCRLNAENCVSSRNFGWEQSPNAFAGANSAVDNPISTDPNWAGVEVSRLLQGDFNGDGIDDIFKITYDGSGASPNIIYFFQKDGSVIPKNVTGFNPYVTPSNTSWANVDLGRIKTGDFNGDGKTDFYRINGEENNNTPDQIFYSKGDGSFVAVSISTSIWNYAVVGTASLGWSQVNVNQIVTGDFDGDGRTDFYFINGGSSGNPDDYVLFSRNSGFATADFEFKHASGINVYLAVGDPSWAGLDASRVKLGDFNGDGLTDIYYIDGTGDAARDDSVCFSLGGGAFDCKTATGVNAYVVSTDLSWSEVDIHRITVGDFNGDGLADIYYVDGGADAADSISFSKGDGSFDTRAVTGFNVSIVTTDSNWANIDLSRVLFGDFNNDGLVDIFQIRGAVNSNPNEEDVIALSKGDGSFDFVPVSGFNSAIDPILAWAQVDVSRTKIGDFNGDGSIDIFYNGGAGSASSSSLYLNSFHAPVVATFPDGIDDWIHVNYETLAQSSGYVMGSPTDDVNKDGIDDTYPVVDVAGAMRVVTSVARDNGIGGVQSNSYKYFGFKSASRGIGSLGFKQLESIDNASGVHAYTTYNQNYDLHTVGMVDVTESRYIKNGTDKQLSLTTNTTLPHDIAYGNFYVRMPYLSHQEVSSWDLVTGDPIGTVSSDFSYYDDGNLDTTSTVTTDPVTGDVFTSTKTTTYYPVKTSPYYLAGLVNRIDSTATGPGSPVTGPISETRATHFAYNDYGAPTLQIVEPDNAHALTTAFEYNAQGQVTKTTTSAPGMTPRSATVQYDSEGREWKQVNALGHTTTFYYENADYPWLRTKTVDPNGRQTVTTYDAWGRAPTVTAADGTSITQITFWCDDKCEQGEIFYSQTTPSLGKPSYVFFDKEGREVRKASYGFDGTSSGRMVYTRTEYNAIGKIARISEPYFEGGVPQWSQTWYDDLGRPQVAYDASGNPMTYVHLGRTVMSTNALAQSKSVETNAQGQTIKVTDNDGGTIEYAYGAFGELIYTKDTEGNVTTATFDIFGNKISMHDPDKGDWTYEYDGYGQLINQTDARGWVTHNSYDILGRKTQQVDRYGTASAETSTWEYDQADLGTTGQKALGMLDKAAKGTYIETYQFDNLGRPSQTNTLVDGVVYTSSTTYDQYSRPVTMTYPGGGLTIRNEYHPELGVLYKVLNNDTNAEYWELQDANARGQASLIQLGNLIKTSRTFNEQTGYLEGITSYVPGQGSNIQEMLFNFDAIGNLQSREEWLPTSEGIKDISETFDYDNLNRLTAAHTNTPLQSYVESVGYDSMGNILQKTNVGTYSYGGTCNGIKAGPHAVTTIVGDKNAVYCYDQNGNMVSGDSKTITYTAFDVPDKIVKGSNSIEFSYGPNHERYKRIDVQDGVTTTTLNVGAYEQVKSGGDTTNRYYVGGFAIISQKNSEALKAQYLLKDHQGSLVGVVEADGTVSERMSYDAWGKRRNANWETMQLSDLFAFKSPTTNRGYTGHEQLDSMGLIHMNGRVYDPTIGRFLSADPFVQDPTNSQSLNRYAYVMNNPLSFTDPSGFFWKKLRKAFKSVTRAIGKVIKAVVKANFDAFLVVTGVFRYGFRKIGMEIGRHKYGAAIVETAGCIAAPYACAAISGLVTMAVAYGATGDWFVAVRAGATAAAIADITASLSNYIHTVSNSVWNATQSHIVGATANTIMHGTLSGAVSEATGGSFRSGFAAGAAGAFGANLLSNGYTSLGATGWNSFGRALTAYGRTAVSTVLGALAARWSGGSAAFGAFQAALGHLFNAEAAQEEAATKGQMNRSSYAPGGENTPNSLTVDTAEFKQCMADCLQNNYGEMYEWAERVSPVSVQGLLTNEAAEALQGYAQKEATRNWWSNNNKVYNTGVRQLSVVKVFSRFNAGMAVAGAGAAGFQAGALGYCAVSCY